MASAPAHDNLPLIQFSLGRETPATHVLVFVLRVVINAHGHGDPLIWMGYFSAILLYPMCINSMSFSLGSTLIRLKTYTLLIRSWQPGSTITCAGQTHCGMFLDVPPYICSGVF